MASSTSAASAIPDEKLISNLQKYCFNELMVRTFQREPGFEELRYRSHQICFVADFARETAGQEMSVNQLAKAFECHPVRVKVALANGFEKLKSRGRHSALDDDLENEILTWIEVQAEKSRLVTRTDTRHYFKTKYSRPVTRGWIDSFILRDGDDLTKTKNALQEDARLEVPGAFLDETICCLREYVQEMKAKLVFSLDKVGMSEWEDRKDKKVIVPKTTDSQTIHHRASRNVKHISIITCISAGGESLTPYIVTSQDSGPFRRRLMSRGVRPSVDFVLRQRSNPGGSGMLFLESINSIFIPYLNELRESEEFARCEAIF
jgi:hypothetical protein